jgi:hypothetical protein
MQLPLGISIDNLGGRQFLTLIHPHIQLARIARGKTSRRLVELMAADTQVGQYAINLPGMMKTKHPAHMPEIVRQKTDPGIIRQVLPGVTVLIEGI